MFNFGMLLEGTTAAATGAADATASTTAAGGSMFGQYGTTIIMIVVLVAVFYLFLIRPENKKKKKLKEMRDSLSVGDDVTTIGGIMGKVVACNNETVTFETGEDRVRVQVAKWAISTIGKATEEPPK